jgi:ribosome-binding protein aMBF1 (putative translation factor)
MKYDPQHFTAPDGTDMVVLTADAYERLRALADEGEEIVDARAVRSRISSGEGTIPGEVLKLILDQGLHPIAAWRRYRGLSQSKLARLSGLSQVWIGRIESGGGYGSRETRRKLAQALDAPLWALDEEFEG